MTETENFNSSNELWMSPEEVGQLIPGHPSPQTVRKWARTGKIPGAYQSPGGRWFLPASAIQRLTERPEHD